MNKRTRPVLHTVADADASMVYPFNKEKFRDKALKNNKDADINDILVEYLKNIGPSSQKLLLEMLNTHITTNKFPSIWRQSMILAILKPGKDSMIPKNYRPISLLCHTYTLYVRIVLH